MTNQLSLLSNRLDVLSFQLHGKHNQKKHGVRRSATGAAWVDAMSEEEYSAVDNWIGQNSRQMRAMIASDGKKTFDDVITKKHKTYNEYGQKARNTTAQEKEEYNRFKDALDQSPAYTKTAFRGMTFDTPDAKDAFVKSISTGFKEGSTSSFSKNKKVAAEFGFDSQNSVMLKVKMKTGNDISHMAKYEKEILSGKGTEFKTTKIIPPKGGNPTIIEMTET
jgi:hypothetical protein